MHGANPNLHSLHPMQMVFFDSSSDSKSLSKPVLMQDAQYGRMTCVPMILILLSFCKSCADAHLQDCLLHYLPFDGSSSGSMMIELRLMKVLMTLAISHFTSLHLAIMNPPFLQVRARFRLNFLPHPSHLAGNGNDSKLRRARRVFLNSSLSKMMLLL